VLGGTLARREVDPGKDVVARIRALEEARDVVVVAVSSVMPA
jgi:hypothetical protein